MREGLKARLGHLVVSGKWWWLHTYIHRSNVIVSLWNPFSWHHMWKQWKLMNFCLNFWIKFDVNMVIMDRIAWWLWRRVNYEYFAKAPVRNLIGFHYLQKKNWDIVNIRIYVWWLDFNRITVSVYDQLLLTQWQWHTHLITLSLNKLKACLVCLGGCYLGRVGCGGAGSSLTTLLFMSLTARHVTGQRAMD